MLKKLLLLIAVSLLLTGSGVLAQGDSQSKTTNAAASEPAKRPPIFRPTKDQIKQVQTMLVSKKLYSGEPSGKYDDATREGIKSFQKDNGLKETGTLNRATLEKFGVALTDKQKEIPVSPNSFASSTKTTAGTKTTTAASSSKTDTTAATTDGPKRPAPFRASVDQIKGAQKILRDGKMLTGGEDGKLDDLTRDGLKKYQEANKIKSAGTLNAETLKTMGIALTDAQKANVAAQAAYDAAKKN